MVGALLRYYSYLFHGALTLFLLAVSGLALTGDPAALRLDGLPWAGSTFTYVVFMAALFGLAAVILAFANKLAAPLLAWSFAVPPILLWGYVFSQYGFAPGEWVTAVLFLAGALIAIAGPWLQVRGPRS